MFRAERARRPPRTPVSPPPPVLSALPVTPTGPAERHQLAELASALSGYGVWARVIESGVPFLRVSNPRSFYAVEDVVCERHADSFTFRTSFGVVLGDSRELPRAAVRTAWLVGAIDR
ncbi:hypothetical protein GCM10027294_20210 [Marinactinospora endophytica]